MPRYLTPLPDKTFEIYCRNKEEIEKFENNNTIWEYKPFLDYIKLFDNSYGYNIQACKNSGLFGSQTYYYTVHLYKIRE